MRKTNFMTTQSGTPFETRCEIIHEFFWHRIDNQEYVAFITENFAGLVLATTYSLNLADTNPAGIKLVNTTFDNFLASEYITSDRGFESYEELIGDIDV